MNRAREMRNLALIGFMGTGKTSVGHLLALALGFRLVDTDQLIEGQIGKRITEIFATEGEARFRAYERQVVEGLTHQNRLVVSTGGGVATNSENFASLKSHALVVCLWASPETIWH